jgi:LmbE family N-acetylglucosaminyl deacetylase
MGALPLIIRFLQSGVRVHVAYFSSCETSVLNLGYSVKQFLDENKQALDFIGIDPNNRHYYDYPTRNFPEKRQNILENLIDLRKNLNPSLVIIPSLLDIHQDHQTVAEEGIRCFKNTSSIIGYLYPWGEYARGGGEGR